MHTVCGACTCGAQQPSLPAPAGLLPAVIKVFILPLIAFFGAVYLAGQLQLDALVSLAWVVFAVALAMALTYAAHRLSPTRVAAAYPVEAGNVVAADTMKDPF